MSDSLGFTVTNATAIRDRLSNQAGKTLMVMEFHGARQSENKLLGLKQALYVEETRELLVINHQDEICYRFPFTTDAEEADLLSEVVNTSEVIRTHGHFEDQSIELYQIYVFTVWGVGESRKIFFFFHR